MGNYFGESCNFQVMGNLEMHQNSSPPNVYVCVFFFFKFYILINIGQAHVTFLKCLTPTLNLQFSAVICLPLSTFDTTYKSLNASKVEIISTFLARLTFKKRRHLGTQATRHQDCWHCAATGAVRCGWTFSTVSVSATQYQCYFPGSCVWAIN